MSQNQNSGNTIQIIDPALSDESSRKIISFVVDFYNKFDKKILKIKNPEIFDTKDLDIPVDRYIKRIMRIMRNRVLRPEYLLITTIYVKRMLRTKKIDLGHQNIRRIILISVMLVHKMFEDIPYNNKYFAVISGVYNIREINTMERDMLKLLNFKLYVDPENFKQFLNNTIAP